ncbi:MAG: mechanosensitive ion channel family protein [Pseudomonadales bacterium]
MSEWQDIIDSEKLQNTVIENITAQWASVISVLPNIVGALVILLLGCLIAWLVKKGSSATLKRLGLDKISSDVGVLGVMDNAGIKRSLSELCGKFFYWLILFMFMVPAADTLGFDELVALIKTLISFLPKIAIALITVILGMMFATFLKGAITSSRLFSNLNSGGTLGNIAYTVIVASVVLMALEQLSIRTELLHNILLIALTAVALALAIALGLGAREVAKNLLLGSYARESFNSGDIIEIADYRGTVEHVNSLNTLIVLQDGERISVPNQQLYQLIVKLKRSSDAQ